MVKKAVIPAAGFGTRFLPLTKAIPKEMVPIVDIPVIQYVVEEAVEAGISDILIIVSGGKRAIEDHFDRSYELEELLKTKGKDAELEAIQKVAGLANIHFIYQKEMKGLGDAILHAKYHVGNEPFAVLLGDTIVESPDGAVTKQLVDAYNKYGSSAVALQEVPWDIVSRYGIVDGTEVEENIFKAKSFIEKPSRDEAPSNLAFAARYVFSADIISYLENTAPGKNNEIQLTDAMRTMLSDKAYYGVKFDGKRYDVGNKLDFIKTNIEFALKKEDIGADLKQWIIELAQSWK